MFVPPWESGCVLNINIAQYKLEQPLEAQAIAGCGDPAPSPQLGVPLYVLGVGRPGLQGVGGVLPDAAPGHLSHTRQQ